MVFPRGALTVGALETTAALRLSRHLADFVTACPQVDLVLRTGTTGELIADVLESRLEGAFVCGPVGHPGLEERLAFQEELAVLTSPAVRKLDDLFDGRAVRIIVLRASCSYRQRLEAILAQRGCRRRPPAGVRYARSLARLRFGRAGVTLLPKSLVAVAARERPVAMHELPPAEAMVDTVFIRQRDAFLSSALVAFLDHTIEPIPAD